MADEKLVKVKLTFDTGRVQTLEGEDAEEWLQNVNICVINSTFQMEEHPWKETHVEQDES